MDKKLWVEGFVLAGGQSSRMGRDKARVDLMGKPLVEWALELLRAAGIGGRIAGARANLDSFAAVVPDATDDCGPLGGVCAALKATTAEWAVFVPVDLPLMPPSLIAFLIQHARLTGRAVTVAAVNGFAQTFPAVVRRDALERIESELLAGRTGCFAAFTVAGASVIPVEVLVQAGQVEDERGLPPYQWFWNVNTPADLERVELALRAR